MHPAFQYAAEGMSIIPVETGEKIPSHLLDHRRWGQFQESPASADQIQGWLDAEPETNWGLVCGRGTGCGDCDDVGAAAWVLADPQRPLFQGACIVRSGSGRAHIWFRYTGDLASTTWRMVPGRKMGEIRAAGNYVLVPPSKLREGGAYQKVAGSIADLPLIEDPAAFLKSIVDAYLAECPDTTPAPDRTSKRILQTNKSQLESTISRVRGDGFKKKILDTLFVRGHQTPGALNWASVDSNSEIDFAVCAEFYRKGWAFADVEVVFAGTFVGEACYRNQDRPNHGQGYLLSTWEAARTSVEKDRQALAMPQGTNFRVVEAGRLTRDQDSLYSLVLEEPLGDRHTVQVDSATLTEQRAFVKLCFSRAGFVPEFGASHAGAGFMAFAKAVHTLSNGNVSQPAPAMTDGSRLRERILQKLERMPDRAAPTLYAETRGLGWRVGDDYWIRSLELMSQLESARTAPKVEDIRQSLEALGAGSVRQHWPDGSSETVIHLRLPPAS